MNSKRPLPQMFGLMLIMLFLVACGGTTAQPTITPVPPTAASTPTPVSIPGIDEPISAGDMMGDMKVRVIDAYTEDKLSSNTETMYPDDPSHTFFEVLVNYEGTYTTDWNRFHRIIKLVCDGEEYELARWGIKLGEGGKYAGELLVFSVSKESKFGRCTLRLSEGVGIELARFFE